MHSMRPRGPRHQIQQILEIAVVSEGEIDHLPVVYLVAHVGSVRLKYRSFGGYYYTFVDGPRLKPEVHSSVGVHHHIHSRSYGFLEPLLLDRHCVSAWGEIGEFVVSADVGGDTADDPRFHLRG